ncbi:hypothetical protein F4054_19075 [Candidatus Poribacteria bacterium]|nr:hypothetical protein [Candidatus Poribacteria bacterium]
MKWVSVFFSLFLMVLFPCFSVRAIEVYQRAGSVPIRNRRIVNVRNPNVLNLCELSLNNQKGDIKWCATFYRTAS